MTLATADDQKKFNLSYASSEACTLCGAPSGDIKHLIAFCTKLCYVKEKCPLAKILPFLPAPVLRGIPPAMTINEHGPFWKEETAPYEASVFWNDYRKAQQSAMTRQFIHQLPEADKVLNARTVMHKYRNDFAILDWDLPPKSLEKAPDEPNVYNDGSLKNA